MVMKSNAVVMKRLLRFYICCIFVCGSLWTIFPLVNRAMGVEVNFTGYFPFDTNNSPEFEIAVAYMNIFITFQAYGNVTMDCTIVAFYAQAKVQLQILRYNLEHLTDFDKTEEKTNNHNCAHKDENEEFRRQLHKKFVQCVKRHQTIKWFVVEIEDIFAEALLFQFFVTAWVICMTVYKIVGLSLFSVEFVSMAMYLCCMLAQFFIYCYYGTQVKYESEYLNQSSYCGPWLLLSPGFRRKMLIMMENCNRPITPRTAYIVPISLETYIAVLRASYTLFTFLDRKHE
ncbi:odorant receptor 4-like [Pectinophora gossypiella]|uniref:odorant receptor 4-like n=1 Tax=Pectinophora gossypiella TaxID=13191 RepID=UPI00214EEA80|nr:odorant receptor 4-like [Pectinophora gossypiella]